jgi:hypothetical protein
MRLFLSEITIELERDNNRIGENTCLILRLIPLPVPNAEAHGLYFAGQWNLWLPGGHVNESDPFGLVCTQCGYLSFYATPTTLAAIADSQEQVRLYREKKQAQADQGQDAPPIKKNRRFL